MLIKLAQKRALAALSDGRRRSAQDLQKETGCAAGDLLELTCFGLARVPDDAPTHIHITPRGAEYLGSLSREKP